jgi:hypothetical protein
MVGPSMKWLIASQLAVVALLLSLPESRNASAAGLCAPLPSLETAVEETGLIVTGTVTQRIFVPPFDPTVPDTFDHQLHFVFSVDEYLKGTGPTTLTIPEGVTKTFDQDGNVITGEASLQFFRDDSVGKRYLLFLPESIAHGPACTWSRQLDGPGYYDIGDEQLIQTIRNILAATPTPATTMEPTPTPNSITGLPRSGGHGKGGSPGSLLTAAAVAGGFVLAAAVTTRKYL